MHDRCNALAYRCCHRGIAGGRLLLYAQERTTQSLAVAERRFPPPWSVEDIGAAFVVKENSGQKLAYVYYEEEPGRRLAAKLLSRNEARRPLRPKRTKKQLR